MSRAVQRYLMLFTDIEGSTGLWEKDGEAMSLSLKTHDALMARAISASGGSIVKHTGDGVFATFPIGADIVPGLVEVHAILSSSSPDLPVPLGLRMGLHCGEAEVRSGDLFGADVGLTQRVMDSCAGGQILLTSEAASCIPIPESAVLVDLGVQRLRDLGEPRQLHLLKHPDMPAGYSPPRTLSSVPNNLLRPLAPFVGRSRELLELRRLIMDDSRRLVTVTGSGGIGKSRLALQAAAEVSINFQGGVHIVQLSGLTSAGQIPPAVASSIGLDTRSSADPCRLVMEYLRGRKVLLLLDNYDHLLPDTGFIESILDNDIGTRVIVTSRERLRSPAESVTRLSGLPAGADGEAGDGEQLFIETADRIGSAPVSPEELPGVTAICNELHGNPLAIILASSWSGVLSPLQILDELRGPDPLTANFDGLPARHTSLSEAFLFSWRLLDDAGRRELCLLSVFRGRFTLEGARNVTGIGLTGIATLVDKSLVERLENGRFYIHPLVLDFVRTLEGNVLDPGAVETVNEIHGRYYCGLVGRDGPKLLHGDPGSTAGELLECMDDIRHGWRTCVDRPDYEGLRTASRGMFALLGHIGAYREGWELFSLAVGATRDTYTTDPLLGWLLTCQGWFGSYCRSSDESHALLRESIDVFRMTTDREGLATALNNLGNALYVSGGFPEAEKCYSESLTLRRELGDRHGVSAVLNNLGNLSCASGDLGAATRAYHESLAIDSELGDGHGAAASLTNLAIVSMQKGEWTEASALLEEALKLQTPLDSRFSMAIIKGHMIDVFFHEGLLDEAEELIRENVKVFAELGNGWGTASTECRSARLLMKRGQVTEASIKLLPPMRSSLDGGWTPLTLELLELSAVLLGRAGLTGEAGVISAFVCGHPSSQRELTSDPAGAGQNGDSTEHHLPGPLTDIRSAVEYAHRKLVDISR